MDKDRITGSTKDFAGRVEGTVGNIAGDTKARRMVSLARQRALPRICMVKRKIWHEMQRTRQPTTRRGPMKIAATRSAMARKLSHRESRRIRWVRL